jgi:cardiolipin synthase A/B
VAILLEDRSPIATLAWIFGLALLPGVGLLVYIVFGPRRLTRKRTRRARARKLIESKAAPSRIRAGQAAAVEQTSPSDLGHALSTLAVRSGEPPPLYCESITLHVEGSDAYDAIVQAIDEAKHHVHLEYYIFEEGKVAERVIDALVRRALAGVEVRVLIDGLGSRLLATDYFRALQRAGGKVAIFNPIVFMRFRPALINFRTHRKILTCDGRIGFTGGMNICDDHERKVVGERAFRDTNVRIIGDAVAALEVLFLEDWAFATGSAPSGESYVHAPEGKGERRVQIVGSGPDADCQFAIYKQYFAAISMARERILLTTAYFVPDEAMMMALTTAAKRGVDVRVLIPRASDHGFVDAAARAFFPSLLAAGVRIHGYERSVLHAKTIVVDRDYAAVGTANIDTRSFKLNFELTAACFDPPFVEELARIFAEDLKHSSEITHLDIERAPYPAQIYTAIAKLFSPIL